MLEVRFLSGALVSDSRENFQKDRWLSMNFLQKHWRKFAFYFLHLFEIAAFVLFFAVHGIQIIPESVVETICFQHVQTVEGKEVWIQEDCPWKSLAERD